MPLKKERLFSDIPPLPERIANTAEIRTYVNTVTCFDDSREVAKKVDEWLQDIIKQVKERTSQRTSGCGKNVPERRRSARTSPAKRHDKCRQDLIGKGEPVRTSSFVARHTTVRNNMPKGFEPMLDKMMREVLLVKPSKLKEFLADFLEAELTRNLVEEHLKDICRCKPKKVVAASKEPPIDHDALVCSDQPQPKKEKEVKETDENELKGESSLYYVNMFLNSLTDLTGGHRPSSYYREMFMTSMTSLAEHGHAAGLSSGYYMDMFLKSLTDLQQATSETAGIGVEQEQEVEEKSSLYYMDMFLKSLTDIHQTLAKKTSSYYRDMFLTSNTDLTEHQLAEKTSSYYRDMFMTSLLDLAYSRSGFQMTPELDATDDLEQPTPLPAPDTPDDFFGEEPSAEPQQDVEDVYDDSEIIANYAPESHIDVMHDENDSPAVYDSTAEHPVHTAESDPSGSPEDIPKLEDEEEEADIPEESYQDQIDPDEAVTPESAEPEAEN